MLQKINDRVKVSYERRKGHVYIEIPIVCEGSIDADRVEFVYDTGAFITVLNQEIYKRLKLNKLPRRETSLGGYAGSVPGYVFKIPGLLMGRRCLIGVWAFTPKDPEIEQNLLGDNVIEYFNPTQDNENNCFYFPDNPKPEPYVHPGTGFSLACDGVMFVGES